MSFPGVSSSMSHIACWFRICARAGGLNEQAPKACLSPAKAELRRIQALNPITVKDGNMEINRVLILSSLVFALFITACASTQKLSQEQVLSQNEKIAQLDKALKDARAQGADYLAPEGYAAAAENLDKAMNSAAGGYTDFANKAASEGLEGLKKVDRDVVQSKDLLREVLAARARAMDAGAATLYAKDTEDLENDLRKTAALVEQGRMEEVKKRRPDLIAGYEQLELVSLKEGMVDTAKATLEKAKENGAAKYAPKTYKLAQEELDLALSVLDADRTKTDKANAHAVRAKWLAERSIGIAELIKDFDRRDYTREDVVLWHQAQLSEIGEPLEEELPFNLSNRDVVISMQSSLKDLIQQRDETAMARSQYEQELSLTEEEKNAVNKVESMFAAFEATVYQQRKNVLISAHGFQFPTGKSELESNNFALLNKIIKAIDTFPDSTIRVSGHTDSTGSDTTNQKLSEARAGKVARFLTEVGGISPSRIKAYGYGESRPVASNETAEGRAANRRVEILIENP
jgi:outer membrane protein OmpA-like peptidoglycan-associated protein